MAIRCPMMLILAMVSSLRISPKLSSVYFVAIPILAVVLLGIVPLVFNIFDRVFKTYDRLNTVVQENVHGIRVVKSFVREDKEVDKFTAISQSIYRDFCKAEHILAVNNPVMQFCVYGCILAISWIGAHLVVASGNNANLGLTTGELSSMFTYTTQILTALMMFSMVFVMMIMARSPLRRCYEILAEEPSLASPENAVKEVADGSIDFDHVSFRYSAKAKRPALQDVELHIPAGSTVGILGATGSSKSTLVQLIPRLYDATEGTVEILGRPAADYPREALRGKVNVVMQKAQLFGGTIRSNLLWGNKNATDAELWAALETAQAAEFVQAKPLGLDEPVEQGGRNLSGGQKQRLTIARALVGKPEILILDDSASALDYATDAALRKALAALPGSLTVFIVSQRAASLQHADQILVLDDGRLVGLGTHDQLRQSCPVYEEIYESQFKKGDVQK